jgi:signal transduction histidine kinase/CheY-like chemotaxis protein
MGVVPTWAFVTMNLVLLTSLFYGVRAGLWMIVALAATHVLIAYGWVSGAFPILLPASQGLALLDLRSASVWTRVLLISGGFLTLILVMLRHVLGDMNSALQESNSTLQRLSVEQEHRARAEEARIMAERSAREAQKFEALGRLASGVAHDFNNALCVIKCWSSYLMEVSENGEVREAMGEIKRSTENAEHLTQHLLAFSRSDATKRQVSDLCEVVEYEARTLGRLLPRNIVVRCETEGETQVPLGKGQLQEVILNLAINARDAMPGGGTLSLQSGFQDLDVPTKLLPVGRYARLVVSDTGTGIDDATMARIYEPFFTTKGPGKGTGLGLAMVYGLVTKAGGTISVQSKLGEGSSFTILLPLATALDLTREAVSASIVTPRRCRVLIVKSRTDIGGLIDKILVREGFPTLWVETGEAAVKAIQASEVPFGLVIVQGVLPGVSPKEILALARSHDSDCRVIVISAPFMDEDLLAGVATGRYHLLTKPFEPDLLRRIVNEALAHPPEPRGLAQMAG